MVVVSYERGIARLGNVERNTEPANLAILSILGEMKSLKENVHDIRSWAPVLGAFTPGIRIETAHFEFDHTNREGKAQVDMAQGSRTNNLIPPVLLAMPKRLSSVHEGTFCGW